MRLSDLSDVSDLATVIVDAALDQPLSPLLRGRLIEVAPERRLAVRLAALAAVGTAWMAERDAPSGAPTRCAADGAAKRKTAEEVAA